MLSQRVRRSRFFVLLVIAAALAASCTRQSDVASPEPQAGGVPPRRRTEQSHLARHLRTSRSPTCTIFARRATPRSPRTARKSSSRCSTAIASVLRTHGSGWPTWRAGSSRPWGGGDGVEGSAPRWSPDGTRIAFQGRTGEGKSGIVIAKADGTGLEPLVDVAGSNHPLPQVGQRFAWSPDGTIDRLRLRDAGTRARDGGGSDRDHSVLVSPCLGPPRSIQRQPPAPSVHCRRSDQTGAATDRWHDTTNTRSTGRPTANGSPSSRTMSPTRISASTTTSSRLTSPQGR